MNQLYPIIRRIRRPLIDDRMEIPQVVAAQVPQPTVEEAAAPEPLPEAVPADAPVAPVEEAPVAIEAPVPKRKKKNGDTAQN